MNYTAEEMYELIDHFIDIDVKNPNDNDIVTYYCDHKDERGFVENIKWRDGGIEKFIARKWILQSTLDRLIDTLRKRKASIL